MLTISLHGIKINAPIGLYPEEKIIGNAFETDVDIWLPDVQPRPFADYTIVHSTVNEAFLKPYELLESLVYDIHSTLKVQFPLADRIKVAVRKLNPPMKGDIAYAQVCYDK